MKRFLISMLPVLAIVSSCGDASKDLPVPAEPLEECIYLGEKTVFSVWAPGAEAAQVRLYRSGADGSAFKIVNMEKAKGGLWKAEVGEDICGTFYTFTVRIEGEWLEETAGIAAKAVGVNGLRGAVVDWSKTNPEGWEGDKSPEVEPSDIIVYEMHHRDFTAHPSSGNPHPGKFLALTARGTVNPEGLSTGMDHLKELGVTCVQLLPSTDYATIDEAALDCPQYNWGYDPQNYNAPEGSYSTNPFDPYSRIREFKQMVQSLHEAGFKVILDVVYNHTFSASKSGFERTVPGYFYRFNEDGSFANGSGCGNETASEKGMFRKFMTESLQWWMTEYHIDGFRFDLMAIHDIATMNYISEHLHAISPDVILYGEGWAAMAPAYPADKLSFKDNVAQLDRIGAFSDNIRDALRGPLDCSNAGFVGGIEGNVPNVIFGLVGGVSHPDSSVPAWAAEPLQHVSYASCHDDHCLRDRFEIAAPEASEAERIRMVKLAQTAVLVSQGLPFLYNGEEVYRSKQGHKNTYNMPDQVNAIDWNLKSRYKDLFDYCAALCAIRHAHHGFCLTDGTSVAEKVSFLKVDNPCAVAFSINSLEGIDSAKSLVVLLNGSKEPVKVDIPHGSYVVLCSDGEASVDGLGAYTGSMISADPISATILAQAE